MSSDVSILLTAGLVALSCGLLGPYLLLRRAAMLGDAVAHAVLPGIVLAFVLTGTRATLPMIAGATLVAIGCVVAVDALARTRRTRVDAALGIAYPALFALGVIGVARFADDVHLDLDATIFGEIAFVPLRTVDVLGVEVPRAVLGSGVVALLVLGLVVVAWRPLLAATFDPEHAETIGLRPRLVERVLLVAVAAAATTAFEAVGAILVVSLLVLPAAAARVVASSLAGTVVLSVVIALVSALLGHGAAKGLDASIAGMMGVVAAAILAVALVVGPRLRRVA